jgi:RNA-directed DNA polymerase
MTAVANPMTQADAPSPDAARWHTIDWHKATRNVRRLQARIVKATKAGNWHKVRALQRLLTHSFSGRVLAVRRVTENQGKRTAGVDGELWDTPEKKTTGVKRLKGHSYKAQPLKRVYILKQDGKRKRPLSIPTMQDRAHQALHLQGLDPVAETIADSNSYGFRRERSPADAIHQLFITLSQKDSAPWILEGDIRACFDELSHPWLLSHIPVDHHSLRQWLKAGYIEKDTFHHTEAGSPQGGVISPVIANLALDGLEPLLKKRFPRRFGKRVNLTRFADDFVITANSREVLQDEVMPLVQTFLQERGLTMSKEKTAITHINDGFDFLGQNIRKYQGKLLIKPSKKSQKALLDKVRTIIKTEGKYFSAYGLIRRLNPVIRGWANYHRHVVSKRAFARVDHHIHMALLRWAKHRHRNKSVHWIIQQYFRGEDYHRNIFQTRTVDEVGKKVTVKLFKATAIPIRRHIKIRKDANPYDPAWELYFEERLLNKVVDDLWDSPFLRSLWIAQKGLCPVCGELITRETGYHNHHIQWRVYGGSDELENRVLLHPNCHRQIHSPDYNGSWPHSPIMSVRDA